MRSVKIILKRIVPYIFIIFFNGIIDFLFKSKNVIHLSYDLICLFCLAYFLAIRLKNRYNRIISFGWILYFFLGILNINSVNQNTNVWDLRIEAPSRLYIFCLIVFILSLQLYEVKSWRPIKVKFKNDFKATTSFFGYLVYAFPILLLLTIILYVGFLPIMSGVDFVDDMYEFNYGPLYGFKFICVYSFLFALIYILVTKRKVLGICYLLLLFFIASIDGKRFVLLLSFLAAVPTYYQINSESEAKNTSRPLLISSLIIGLIYILINGLRAGHGFADMSSTLLDNLPFGVEYKDYVHSFNVYKAGKIEQYNFELSALGSFANSSILHFLGFNKEAFVSKGSAYAWMKLYNNPFGIRTGIISELYFAYGYTVIFLMIPLAFITNKVSCNLTMPKSYFNLVQNSILFALIFLMINGQATVFFGCLPMMIYAYFFYLVFYKRKVINTKNDFHSYPCA